MKTTLLQLPLLFLLLVGATAHAQPLGPTNAPPGVTDAAWVKMHGRADWVARTVAALARNVNKDCVYAVALEKLGEAERAWSEDAPGRDGAPRTVTPGKEQDFTRSLKKNSEDQCGGPGSGLTGTVRGLLLFAAKHGEWDEGSYERLKVDAAKAAEALVKLGAFVPVAESAAAAPAGITLPILNPELFMRRSAQVGDGT